MNRENAIDILSDLIKIKTVNGNELEVANYLKDLLLKNGIQSKLVKFAENRANLIAEIENGPGKTLVLSGHMDVVSPGDESQWTFHPFEAHIEDDVIWGRGTSDMKSGLAALTIAFIETAKEKNFSGKIKLIATVGEEIGELGAEQLTDLGYVEDVDAILIAEPCNLGVVYAHKGSLNYKVSSKGVAAHSSTPEIGKNAVEHLNRAMSEISKHFEKRAEDFSNEMLGKMTHSITVVEGGTQVNSIPDFAEFEANVRTIPELKNQQIIEEIQEILARLNKEKDFELNMEVTANQSPVQSDANSKLVKTIIDVVKEMPDLLPMNLMKSMGEVLGKDLRETLDVSFSEIKPMAVAGTTDAAQFMKDRSDIELAVYGPGMPMLNHKIDERLPLKQYIDFIEAYIRIIDNYMNV
ncbi:ArgE/DapE family deacylase [Peptoniphilus sp. SGI.035]|uniref:ArgE/DapE family deacylase n=1 Tax=Peptoniphilus sp. SGI.035 TaxID=3420564 RepID=UPI003D029A0B